MPPDTFSYPITYPHTYTAVLPQPDNYSHSHTTQPSTNHHPPQAGLSSSSRGQQAHPSPWVMLTREVRQAGWGEIFFL